MQAGAQHGGGAGRFVFGKGHQARQPVRGQFTAQCPGKITVKAGQKAMVGPGNLSWAMPKMPQTELKDCLEQARQRRVAIQERS